MRTLQNRIKKMAWFSTRGLESEKAGKACKDATRKDAKKKKKRRKKRKITEDRIEVGMCNVLSPSLQDGAEGRGRDVPWLM